MDKILYLVRHCSAKGQALDAELTEEGNEQAEKLNLFFTDKCIDQIVSSPYTRAVKSIEKFSMSSKLEVEIDARLGERILSTNVYEDWLEKLEESFSDFDLSFEGGESSRDASKRAKEVLDRLMNNDKKNILLVSHGNLTTLMLKMFDEKFGFKDWKAMTNPDVFKVEIKEGTYSVTRIWN